MLLLDEVVKDEYRRSRCRLYQQGCVEKLLFRGKYKTRDKLCHIVAVCRIAGGA